MLRVQAKPRANEGKKMESAAGSGCDCKCKRANSRDTHMLPEVSGLFFHPQSRAAQSLSNCCCAKARKVSSSKKALPMSRGKTPRFSKPVSGPTARPIPPPRKRATVQGSRKPRRKRFHPTIFNDTRFFIKNSLTDCPLSLHSSPTDPTNSVRWRDSFLAVRTHHVYRHIPNLCIPLLCCPAKTEYRPG